MANFSKRPTLVLWSFLCQSIGEDSKEKRTAFFLKCSKGQPVKKTKKLGAKENKPLKRELQLGICRGGTEVVTTQGHFVGRCVAIEQNVSNSRRKGKGGKKLVRGRNGARTAPQVIVLAETRAEKRGAEEVAFASQGLDNTGLGKGVSTRWGISEGTYSECWLREWPRNPGNSE